MARSRIVDPTDDLVTDTGSILFSLIQGEQLELPVVLEGLEQPAAGYLITATLREAANVALQTSPPDMEKVGGVLDTLTVRVPPYIGAWQTVFNYNEGDLVSYQGEYYICIVAGSGAETNTASWETIHPGTAFIRFTSLLSTDWDVQPTASTHTYGFLEVKAEETTGAFARVWKPIRGMVQYQYTNL